MVKRYLGGIISAILPSTTTTSASGMYNATSATQLKQAGNWPSAPGAPTGVSAVPGNATATITFTPPVNNGGSAITTYTVTSSPGNITASGGSSPITVTGLTNGTTYTFTVVATNVLGNSVSSSASNSVTPSAFDFQITPAVGGVTNWVFAVNGSLSISTAGEYTILWGANSSKVVKMWGGGGRPNSGGSTGWGAGGAGGAAVGTVAFTQGTTYILRVGGAGANGTAPANAYGAGNSGGVFSVGTAGSGGGYTGLFSGSVSQANAVLMAGGGGGGASSRGDGLGGRSGYAGGGTTGASGGDFVAGSGTQSAGGSAAGSGSPTSGSALQGGNGSNGGAGGGGGYFGGGGGGSQGDGGYGGGGGSGYFKPSDVTSATLYTGSGTVTGNNSDADKPTNAGAGNTAGSASFPGAFVLKA
jgi:Fibronectin type III domain/Glycine rich protein